MNSTGFLPFDVYNIHLYDCCWDAESPTSPGKYFAGSNTRRLLDYDPSSPYSAFSGTKGELEVFRQFLDDLGYSSKPIWITEFGMVHRLPGPYTAPFDDPGLVSYSTDVLNRMVNYFIQHKTSLKLERWFPFTSYNYDPSTRVFPILFFTGNSFNELILPMGDYIKIKLLTNNLG